MPIIPGPNPAFKLPEPAGGGGGGGSPVAITQSKIQRESPVGTTETIAFDSTPAANAGLVMFIGTYGETVSNVTDAGGNTWTFRQLEEQDTDGNGKIYIYTARAASNPGTITITKTNNFSNPAEVCIVEIANTLTSGDAFDADGSQSGNGTSASASVTTTATGAFLLGVSHVGSTQTLAAGAGMTQLQENENNSSGVCLWVGWKRVTSSGAESGSCTIGGTVDWLAAAVNMKEQT